MFITQHRYAQILKEHDAEVGALRRHVARLDAELTRAQEARDNARADQAMWRDTARQALANIAELQRRYAPPAPIEGDVEQPVSVHEADRRALAELRHPTEATP